MKTIEIFSDWAQISDDSYGNKKVKIRRDGKLMESVVSNERCYLSNGIYNNVSVIIDQFRSDFKTYESIFQIELDT